MKTKHTAEEKRRIRLLVKSHFDHAVHILRHREDGRFLARAERSIQEGHDLLMSSKAVLPSRSFWSLHARHVEVQRRLREAHCDWCFGR